MINHYLPLQPGSFYHVFNRGNNRENLFRNAENYRYFLQKYAKYMEPVLDTYAYACYPTTSTLPYA